MAGGPCRRTLATRVNSETLLLRQIHPRFVQHDRVTSQAFTPRATDRNRLSVYDGDQIQPAAAWRHYTAEQSLLSAGVMAVSVAECTALDLPVRPDPQPFPEHAVIDFGVLGRNAINRAAKRLREAASRRGWRYRAS